MGHTHGYLCMAYFLIGNQFIPLTNNTANITIKAYTPQSQYKVPHYNAVVSVTQPCHGSQINCFVITIKAYTGQPSYNAIFGIHGNRPCYK